MAAESKVRKRQAAEGKEAQKESPPGNVWQIGRFRVELGKDPRAADALSAGLCGGLCGDGKL